jgi:hypothetical protein
LRHKATSESAIWNFRTNFDADKSEPVRRPAGIIAKQATTGGYGFHVGFHGFEPFGNQGAQGGSHRNGGSHR